LRVERVVEGNGVSDALPALRARGSGDERTKAVTSGQ
jgi:hypothetical protein